MKPKIVEEYDENILRHRIDLKKHIAAKLRVDLHNIEKEIKELKMDLKKFIR